MNTPTPQGPAAGQAGHVAPPGPEAYTTGGHAAGGQPPGAPYSYGPPQSPMPPPQKKSWFARHKFLTVLLAIVALIIIVPALSGGGEDSGTPSADDGSADATDDGAQTPAEPDAGEEPEVPGLNTAVRDGDFEFSVTGVEGGVSTIGEEYLSEEAQGQFVLIDLTVTNIGEESQTLFGDNQTLLDEQGREHSADTMAGVYLEDNDTFVNEINPGNTATGTVVFDIPADAVPTSINLHDSAFSGGVTVSLEQ